MSEVLIDSVKKVDKWKRAIPILEEMVQQGNYGCYVAASLMISPKYLGYDDDAGISIQAFDIEPISEIVTESLRHAQQLCSKIFVKHKEGSCYYEQAVHNVEEYESSEKNLQVQKETMGAVESDEASMTIV